MLKHSNRDSRSTWRYAIVTTGIEAGKDKMVSKHKTLNNALKKYKRECDIFQKVIDLKDGSVIANFW